MRASSNGVNRAGTRSVQDKQNGKKQEDGKKEREGQTRDKMPTDQAFPISVCLTHEER